ncbi:hypothetical protein [Anabaena lutea]|uniref:Uncharacterized protein n=1 Tax=Anabaena lutea FACHB-196 TaxID=2692881 RepID=A0ABR8FKN4_9NOST|nr:hypothetical protein [Anabaena lutea]MBD2570755.1 hypothetical protein [Anabaena lutea FACHB-196]
MHTLSVLSLSFFSKIKYYSYRIEKNKSKKYGFEKLFATKITELSDKDTLVEKSIILFERYFNLVFSVFKKDKPTSRNEPKTSFLLSKFWGGWVNLLNVFLEEDLDWKSVENELNKIKSNIMELRQMENYNDIIFKPDELVIPDSSHSPTKVGKFLNQNRQQPVSIQDIS